MSSNNQNNKTTDIGNDPYVCCFFGSLSNTLKYKGRQKHDDVFIYLFSYGSLSNPVDEE